MKVLQVINSLSTGGAEKLILDSVPLYQKRGCVVDVLTLKNTKTPFWLVLERFTNGKMIGLTGHSVYNPFLLFKIVPYLKKYDVIHAHLFPTLYWVVLAKVISGSNTPIIYTEHNTHNKRRNNFLLKRIDQFIYKKLSKIVTIAEEVDVNLKKHLKETPSKFQLINNGVNIDLFTKAEPLSKAEFFNQDDLLIIQVSSFREQKDQPTLIKALPFLPPRFKLLLAGDGPLRKQNENLVAELNLTDRVAFLGIRTDIPALLKTADFIVLSSHYEGLSLSSIEGMAVNKPFIASDVPGLREIVKGYGVLFQQGDSPDLANQILALYHDDDAYQKVAHECGLRAQEFDITKMISSYIAAYHGLTC